MDEGFGKEKIMYGRAVMVLGNIGRVRTVYERRSTYIRKRKS